MNSEMGYSSGSVHGYRIVIACSRRLVGGLIVGRARSSLPVKKKWISLLRRGSMGFFQAEYCKLQPQGYRRRRKALEPLPDTTHKMRFLYCFCTFIISYFSNHNENQIPVFRTAGLVGKAQREGPGELLPPLFCKNKNKKLFNKNNGAKNSKKSFIRK